MSILNRHKVAYGYLILNNKLSLTINEIHIIITI